MKVFYHPRFRAAYQRLPTVLQRKAERKERMFRADPFDRRLRIHKLHGALAHLWSFSIDEKYRILFEFDEGDVIFLDIGDHKIYR